MTQEVDLNNIKKEKVEKEKEEGRVRGEKTSRRRNVEWILFCARNCCRHFTYIHSLNPHRPILADWSDASERYQVLIPRTCECYPIWGKRRFLRM